MVGGQLNEASSGSCQPGSKVHGDRSLLAFLAFLSAFNVMWPPRPSQPLIPTPGHFAAAARCRSLEVDPETVVAAHLHNFHQAQSSDTSSPIEPIPNERPQPALPLARIVTFEDRFCGTWRLQPFSSDGHPVFAKYDKSLAAG